MATAVANRPRPSNGETLQERSKGKDVRISNIVAAKVSYCIYIIVGIVFWLCGVCYICGA